MDEKRIWAPWRIGYISGDKQESRSDAPAPFEPSKWSDGADRACFLCRSAATESEPLAVRHQNLVLAHGPLMTALLNRYPYTNGHLLVAPHRHVAELHELTADEHLEAMQSIGRFTQLLSKLFQADGFNVGLNLGQAAGAGVPGHLHWHLVPRWQGDHNFMPTLAGARVIPQSLDAVWEAITESL